VFYVRRGQLFGNSGSFRISDLASFEFQFADGSQTLPSAARQFPMRYSWINRFTSQNPDTAKNWRIPYLKPHFDPSVAKGRFEMKEMCAHCEPIASLSCSIYCVARLVGNAFVFWKAIN
jgi:hypothetical protein